MAMLYVHEILSIENTLKYDLCIVSAVFVYMLNRSSQYKAGNGFFFKIIFVIYYKNVLMLFIFVSNLPPCCQFAEKVKIWIFSIMIFK